MMVVLVCVCVCVCEDMCIHECIKIILMIALLLLVYHSSAFSLLLFIFQVNSETGNSQTEQVSRRRRIAFKGAIREFLQSPHCAANCLQHVHSSGPGAMVCNSRATYRALIVCHLV